MGTESSPPPADLGSPAGLPPHWRGVLARLAREGLGVAGVAEARSLESWLPGCRAAVVVGSGGAALWRALRAEPERWQQEPHPLDRFVREAVGRADPAPRGRWVFADFHQDPPLSIQPLALAAGLGWPSRLGLVLHPTYGPWMGLRAVCLTRDALAPTGPLPGEGPCESCPAPCIPACPGGALSAGGMHWRRCVAHRQSSSDCLERCHSRAACPEGAAHRYDPAEERYHHDPARHRDSLWR